jgi:hypothetical protein
MKARLLVLSRFAHDPQSVLAAVLPLALMRLELFLDGDFIRCSEWGYGAKLQVAVLADSKQRLFSHDPKFSLCHTPSLRCPIRRSTPVDFKRHHYRNFYALRRFKSDLACCVLFIACRRSRLAFV